MHEDNRSSITGRGWQEMVPEAGLPFDVAPSPSVASRPSEELFSQTVASVFDRFDWEGLTAEREIPAGISVDLFFRQVSWDFGG